MGEDMEVVTGREEVGCRGGGKKVDLRWNNSG